MCILHVYFLDDEIMSPPPQFVVPSWLAADGATSEKVTHSFIDGFQMGRANYTFIKSNNQNILILLSCITASKGMLLEHNNNSFKICFGADHLLLLQLKVQCDSFIEQVMIRVSKHVDALNIHYCSS